MLVNISVVPLPNSASLRTIGYFPGLSRSIAPDIDVIISQGKHSENHGEAGTTARLSSPEIKVTPQMG
jgi:hypothetical protein